MLPVPLNSSKMTSSMRLPVSMRAVAMIVRLPPSSILRAAPKRTLWPLQGIRIDTAREDFTAGRLNGVVGARQAGDAVQ